MKALMKSVYSGFKFGLLLQLAIGPVFIYIINLSLSGSFLYTLKGIFGVIVADSFYIILALLGMVKIFTKKNQDLLNKIGSLILITFGLSLIIKNLNLPIDNLLNNEKSGFDSSFINGLILTLSNPLTILFWFGVFSNHIGKENIKNNSLFALGSILSTFIFLFSLSLISKSILPFVNSWLLVKLNIFVGILFIYFGGKRVSSRKS